MLIGLEVRSFFEAQPSARAHSLLSICERLVAQNSAWRFTFLYRANQWRSGWQEFAQRFRSLLERPNVRSLAVPLDADPADSWLHVRLPMTAQELGLQAIYVPDGVPSWCPVPVVTEISRSRWETARAAAPGSVVAVMLRVWEKALLRGASFMVEDEDIAEWVWSHPNAAPNQVEIVPHWFSALATTDPTTADMAPAAETLAGLLARSTTAPRQAKLDRRLQSLDATAADAESLASLQNFAF